MKDDKYSLIDFMRDFPDDPACTEFIFDALHSRVCSCGGRYSLLRGRRQLQCSKCRYQIAPTVGTIFEKSATSLKLWFHALWIFSNAKSGISAKEMERQLGVTYKTAWRILRLIRSALKQRGDKLRGSVEMDEAYMGGKTNAGTNNVNLSLAFKSKSAVIGAVSRGSDMKMQVVPNIKAKTVKRFLRDNVETGSTLLTDDSTRYIKVTSGYNRYAVNHSKGQYAKGDVHINNVEGFWSHFKRSISGTHKAISKQHLQSYLDGFVWHYNNRHNDSQRFVSLLGVLLHVSK